MRAEPNPEGVGPVMANGFCNFIRQIEYPGEIVARHYVAAPRPGAKSLDTYFTLSMADTPDVISANGGATLVWLDFPNKKTVPLPDDLRAACRLRTPGHARWSNCRQMFEGIGARPGRRDMTWPMLWGYWSSPTEVARRAGRPRAGARGAGISLRRMASAVRGPGRQGRTGCSGFWFAACGREL